MGSEPFYSHPLGQLVGWTRRRTCLTSRTVVRPTALFEMRQLVWLVPFAPFLTPVVSLCVQDYQVVPAVAPAAQLGRRSTILWLFVLEMTHS